VIWSKTTVNARDGTLLWTRRRSIFARGEGGFGGERGPLTSSEPPQRAPDFELAIPVSPRQALLYTTTAIPYSSESGIRSGRRLPQSDPARDLHVRHGSKGQ
jgi:hypothetical protein